MWLVATRNVSSSTHRQALSALLFLYGKVLGVELPWFNPVAVVATRNLRYIGMIKLTGVEINEPDPLISNDQAHGRASARPCGAKC